MPIGTLLAVFVALVVLTLLTYTASDLVASYDQLKPFSVPIAMGIATAKAIMVCLYFMHLRHDKSLNNVVFFFSFAFFFLFIIFVLVDTWQYQGDVSALEAARAQEQAATAPAEPAPAK
jgi:cytochrome c oxidase subunit 4